MSRANCARSARRLPLRREPRFDATLDTEALFGETVTVYDEREGWAWVQLERDGYVGYMPSEGLARDIAAPTHRVAVLRTYVYPEPDGKTPPLALLSFNALVTVSEAGGQVPGPCGRRLCLCRPRRADRREAHQISSRSPRAFIGTPYLWGGRTSVGLDCSGLVQLALEAAGHAAPRDADMQAAELGRVIGPRKDATSPRRSRVLGGPCRHHDEQHGVSARQCVSHGGRGEPFAAAKRRIQEAGYEVTCLRRLPRSSSSAAARGKA